MTTACRTTLGLVALGAAAVLGGCAARSARPDPLTFGMVKESLRTGVTTQHDVLSLFGAPNIITRTHDGHESWAYERSAYGSHGWDAGVTALGGGLPGAALAGGVASLWSYDHEASSRTTTVLVTFDPEGRVADYAVQETHF